MRWLDSLIILGLFSVIGTSVDKLLLKRQKIAIQEILIKYWNRIDEIKISDLTPTMVQLYTFFIDKIFGKTYLKRIVVSVIVSLSITVPILYFFSYYDYSIISPVFWTEKFNRVAIPVNYLYDVLTVLTTIFLVKKMINASVIKKMFLLFTDLFMAYIFAVLCTTTCAYIIQGQNKFLQYFESLFMNYIYLLKSGNRWENSILSDLGVAYCSTTFIPTFVYIIIFISILISKPILSFFKRISLHLLELSTEDTNKSVFLYTGTLLGILQLVLKTFYSLVVE